MAEFTTPGGGGSGGAPETYQHAGTLSIAASESYSIPIYLGAGTGVTFERIGGSLTDGTTDASVYIRQYNPTGTAVAAWPLDAFPKLVETFTQSPYENTSGSAERATWRIENESATDYTPDSAAADGVEYEITYRIEDN